MPVENVKTSQIPQLEAGHCSLHQHEASIGHKEAMMSFYFLQKQHMFRNLKTLLPFKFQVKS